MLEWSEVDLESGVVTVTRSARTDDRGGVRVKEVKTRASRRRIRLTRRTVAVLRDWRRQCQGNLVFPARRCRLARGHEKYLSKGNRPKTLARLLLKAEVPSIRFHDLRHTHATLALLKTKNVKAVPARLGHSDIRVMLNVYAHYLPTMEEELVLAMEGVLTSGADMPHNLPQRAVQEQATSK